MEIEARHLTKDFGGVRAVDDLTFRFEGPGLVGYLGPNGAGKTTTLKLFSNLLRPTSGGAFVDGIEVARDYPAALAKVSALVETPEPYPHQTVEEFLTFVGRLRGLDRGEVRRRIAELRERLSLEELGTRTGRLSRGHKQRVMLAATLLPQADILLLDEPTSGLDPAEARDVRTLLGELKGERLLLMSSHLLYEVTSVCDRVAFLNKGKLLLVDTVEGIRQKFSTRGGIEGLEEAYIRLVRGEGA